MQQLNMHKVINISPFKGQDLVSSFQNVTHDAKFSSFFFVIAPSSNKTNELIPHHLIISKHKYYNYQKTLYVS
jgi:hypothetical protein